MEKPWLSRVSCQMLRGWWMVINLEPTSVSVWRGVDGLPFKGSE